MQNWFAVYGLPRKYHTVSKAILAQMASLTSVSIVIYKEKFCSFRENCVLRQWIDDVDVYFGTKRLKSVTLFPSEWHFSFNKRASLNERHVHDSPLDIIVSLLFSLDFVLKKKWKIEWDMVHISICYCYIPLTFWHCSTSRMDREAMNDDVFVARFKPLNSHLNAFTWCLKRRYII